MIHCMTELVYIHTFIGLAIGLSILALLLAVGAVAICVLTVVIIKRKQRLKNLQGKLRVKGSYTV